MSVLPFASEQTVREQAGAWLARMDRGLSEAERAQLLRWLQEHPRHRAIFLEISALWDRMDVLAEISTLFPLEGIRKYTWRHSAALWFACAFVAVIGIALAAWSIGRQPVPADSASLGRLPDVRQLPDARQSPDVRSSYSTAVGEQRKVELPDGSTVMLNTATQLRVDYAAAARRIELVRGEAHFNVAKDAARVFAVQVGQNEFRAVGTAFNIRLNTDRVELTVTEGKVRALVSPQGSQLRPANRPAAATATEIMVDAGKEVSIARDMQLIAPLLPAQIDATVAWTRGMIVFDHEPLEHAIREVSRYSTLHLVVDEGIKNIPVTGYFRVGDIEGLLASLQNNFEIDADRSGSSIVLSPRDR